MAERRMFAKTIIDSDAFLDMPLSTQALYFHLAMRADDDGFINNPKKIQRLIGASDDDLKLLIAKNFIIPFESGVMVIKHWRIHNYIQADRYKPTVYTEEKAMLSEKENKAYTLDTKCIQDVYILETQDRLIIDNKDKLIRDNIYGDSEAEKKPKQHIETLSEKRFNDFWKLYPRREGKGAARKAWEKINPNAELFEKIMTAVQNNLDHNPQWQKQNGQFIPHPATWLNQGRWDDDIDSVVHEDWLTREIREQGGLTF